MTAQAPSATSPAAGRLDEIEANIKRTNEAAARNAHYHGEMIVISESDADREWLLSQLRAAWAERDAALRDCGDLAEEINSLARQRDRESDTRRAAISERDRLRAELDGARKAVAEECAEAIEFRRSKIMRRVPGCPTEQALGLFALHELEMATMAIRALSEKAPNNG